MISKKIVGITGGIGCGKTTVTDLFAKLGPNIVDADLVAREVVTLNSAGLNAIHDQYGAEILLQSGELDRAKLREIIFNDTSQKQWLETLLHPLIRTRIINSLHDPESQNDCNYNILSSPLLLETDQQQMCDVIIVIDLDKETQIKRAMVRDKQRNEKADITINNDGTLAQLNQQVNNIHQQLCARFSI